MAKSLGLDAPQHQFQSGLIKISELNNPGGHANALRVSGLIATANTLGWYTSILRHGLRSIFGVISKRFRQTWLRFT
jgi:hypothetical protein